MRGKYKKISSKICYDGRFMQVFRDDINYPNGEKGIYEHYKKNDIVVIVPIYRNQFVLIEQYRYLANERMIEFPMGLINDGENIVDAGIRELKEETGLISDGAKYLGKCMLNKGATSQVCHFIQTNVNSVSEPNYDKSESDIDVIYMDYDKVESSIREGKIFDGPTMIGFIKSNLHKTHE